MGASVEQIVTIKRTCEPLVNAGERKLSYHDTRKGLQWHAEAAGVIGLARVVSGLDGAGKAVFTHNISKALPEHTHTVLRRAHEEAAVKLAEQYGLTDEPVARISHYASASELRAEGVEHVTRSYDIPAKHVPVYLYAAEMLTRNSTILDDGRPAREFRVYINEDVDTDSDSGDAVNVFHQGAGQRSLSYARWDQFNRLRDGAIVAFDHRYNEGYPIDDAYTRAYTHIDESLQCADLAERAPLLPSESFAPALGWLGRGSGF